MFKNSFNNFHLSKYDLKLKVNFQLTILIVKEFYQDEDYNEKLTKMDQLIEFLIMNLLNRSTFLYPLNMNRLFFDHYNLM